MRIRRCKDIIYTSMGKSCFFCVIFSQLCIFCPHVLFECYLIFCMNCSYCVFYFYSFVFVYVLGVFCLHCFPVLVLSSQHIINHTYDKHSWVIPGGNSDIVHRPPPPQTLILYSQKRTEHCFFYFAPPCCWTGSRLDGPQHVYLAASRNHRHKVIAIWEACSVQHAHQHVSLLCQPLLDRQTDPLWHVS